MQNIKDLAIAKEKRNVRVPIQSDDLEEMKSRYIEKSVVFKQLADEKANAVALLKERMSPIQKEITELMELISNEYDEQLAECYLLDDQEKGIMRYYLEDGTEVYSRPLRPDEKQLNLLSIKQSEVS